MSDVRNRLRALDELDPPEMWSDAIGREPRATIDLYKPSRFRKVAVIVTAFTMTLAAMGFLVNAFSSSGPGQPVSRDQSNWIRGAIPKLGVSFRYPPQWHLQPFDETVGHVGFVGAVVSNVDQDLHHPDQGPNEHTTAWDLSGLPPQGVVISIEHVDAIGTPLDTQNSQFPVSLTDAELLPPTRFSGATKHLWVAFTLNGRLMGARVYFGPDASAQDRQLARDIVATIQPTHAPPDVPQPGPDDRDPAGLAHQSFSVDGPAGAIAAGDGWVWVATNDFDGGGAILDKVDPSTGEVTSSIPLPDSPQYLAAGGGNVWAPVNPAGGDPVLLQIDAARVRSCIASRGYSDPWSWRTTARSGWSGPAPAAGQRSFIST